MSKDPKTLRHKLDELTNRNINVIENTLKSAQANIQNVLDLISQGRPAYPNFVGDIIDVLPNFGQYNMSLEIDQYVKIVDALEPITWPTAQSLLDFIKDKHIDSNRRIDRIYEQIDNHHLGGRFACTDEILDLVASHLDELETVFALCFLTITLPAARELKQRADFVVKVRECLTKRHPGNSPLVYDLLAGLEGPK